MSGMLTDADLAVLFRDQETDRVERKASLTHADRVKEAICAFANDYPRHAKPGVIFIGQNDDLSCAGLTIDAKLLETLGGWRSDGNILPFPSMAVRRVTIDGCEVAAVIVEPSDNPPVRCNGRTWIRVGPRRAIATVAEENRLIERRQWLNLPPDARGIPGTGTADLDLRRFQLEYLPLAIGPEMLAANGRSVEEQLRALRFLDADGHATMTALLTIGIEPLRWLPGAYIQFLALDGALLTDPIRDQKRLGGTIGDQLRRADELIELLITTPAVIGSRRIETPSYPADALKQVIRNAVLHRRYTDTTAPVRFTWYADRVEIVSPGGLFGGVTAANFGEPGATDYRNPTLAEAMRTLGYAERFGIGLQIVRQSLARNGNPPAAFRIEDHFVHVEIRTRP
jgi:ATP-dependent DNA helicase RecG